MLEFFVLTPLPGSEDHKVLAEKGVWMDPDMNKYELEHVVTAHAKMSKDEWQERLPHRLGHLLHRRASGDRAAPRLCLRHQYPLADAGAVLVLERGAGGEFASAAMGHFPHQAPHATAARACRSKSPIPFYARYAAEIARKVTLRSPSAGACLKRIVRKIEADPNAKVYMDGR